MKKQNYKTKNFDLNHANYDVHYVIFVTHTNTRPTKKTIYVEKKKKKKKKKNKKEKHKEEMR